MNNPLNELSAVYNQSIAEGCGCDEKKKVKMKPEMLPQGKTPMGGDGARPGKNRKAYVEPMSNEGYAPGDVDKKVGAVTPIPKDEREAAKARILAKAKAKRAMKEGHCEEEGVKCSPVEKKKDSKRNVKEHVSWRDDLREYVGSPADNDNVTKASPKKDTEAQKEIKEKNITNKIKINPPQGVTEGFEQLGGVIVEMYELDEASYESAAAKVDSERAAKKAATDKRMTITNADKKGNTPAYQNYMKGDKRYKTMGEKLDMKKADMGDVIKDFRKSDAPQFKGKSDKKIQKMAIAAKLGSDEMSEESESDKKKREMLAKTKEHDDKRDGKLAEQSGGGLSKLGPREEGKRKEKGRSKPQAIRQSKARLVALKKRLNVEGLSIEDQMRISREHNRKRQAGQLPKPAAKKPMVNKDTRSDSEKMADAYASPRKGPGGATRAD